MARAQVLITDSDLPGKAIEQTLDRAGHSVCRAPGTSAAEITAAGQDAVALVVQWATITEEMLDSLPNVRFISRLGIGFDMIDVDAATARGIAVANTPSYCVEEVSIHTMAMILSLSRGIIGYDQKVRAGKWSAVSPTPMAVRASSSTVSVVGFGKIGSVVARGCSALGFRVLVADPHVNARTIRTAGLVPASLAEAIAQADVLTLHAPLTSDTHHLINETSLASMKSGSIVVNTCRGELIDEHALEASLASAHTGAAGLDVFSTEPLAMSSPLRRLKNVVITPHAAWYSPQAFQDLPVHAANNVVDFLANQPVVSVVNPAYREAART